MIITLILPRDPYGGRFRKARFVRRFLTLLLLSAWFAFAGFPHVNAAFTDKNNGVAGVQFLKIAADAKGAGMGEAYSAVTDDAAAIYWNPAGLDRINSSSIGLTHAVLLNGLSYQFLGYGQRIGESGVVGIGAQYLSVPEIKETDIYGLETGGKFSPEDLAVSIAYAGPMPFSESEDAAIGSIGFSVKFIRSRIVDTADAWAGDIGILSPQYLIGGQPFYFSVVAQNMGRGPKYDLKQEKLPFNLKTGCGITLKNIWKLALDVNLPSDNAPVAAAGIEYRAAMSGGLAITGRAGFNSRTIGDVSGLTGLSLGFGAEFSGMSLDYAFVPYGPLGYTHRISLSFRFGNSVKPPSNRF